MHFIDFLSLSVPVDSQITIKESYQKLPTVTNSYQTLLDTLKAIFWSVALKQRNEKKG